MTRYFMHNETGSVFTIEEIQFWYEDENFNGSFEDYLKDFTEVTPIVDNPDDSNPDDWEALK